MPNTNSNDRLPRFERPDELLAPLDFPAVMVAVTVTKGCPLSEVATGEPVGPICQPLVGEVLLVRRFADPVVGMLEVTATVSPADVGTPCCGVMKARLGLIGPVPLTAVTGFGAIFIVCIPQVSSGSCDSIRCWGLNVGLRVADGPVPRAVASLLPTIVYPPYCWLESFNRPKPTAGAPRSNTETTFFMNNAPRINTSSVRWSSGISTDTRAPRQVLPCCCTMKSFGFII